MYGHTGKRPVSAAEAGEGDEGSGSWCLKRTVLEAEAKALPEPAPPSSAGPDADEGPLLMAPAIAAMSSATTESEEEEGGGWWGFQNGDEEVLVVGEVVDAVVAPVVDGPQKAPFGVEWAVGGAEVSSVSGGGGGDGGGGGGDGGGHWALGSDSEEEEEEFEDGGGYYR